MHTPTLIIGGGLSGLALSHHLQKAGRAFHLVEARNRFGGRIKSLSVAGKSVDLGPSWVWPGQERVFALTHDLGLDLFEQWSSGEQLFEQADGRVMRNAGFMSMAGSLRVAGGTSALTDALAGNLNSSDYTLGATVVALDDTPSATLKDGTRITADQIVLALPPRLIANLNITPALPDASTLSNTPTWMGAHAKFVAIYDRPFWREAGLSGDASSRRGPMVEIHDASPADASYGALFGFVGIPAHIRKDAGQALDAACLTQLGHLFGEQAAKPITSKLEDWSAAPLTATSADATPPAGHPAYLLPAAFERVWDHKLIFATTEMTTDNGGLIEGALAAAERAAAIILQG